MPVRETLNANPATLGEIFSNGRRYVVPPFQRDYAWTHTEWLELWDDLRKVSTPGEGAEHYLGAIVVQQMPDGRRSVVDGQQRLVTLSLLALAVINRIEALAESGIEAEENRTRVRLLREKFVSTQSPASLQHHPRLRLNETNNPIYSTYLVAGERPPKGLIGSNKALVKALQFFSEKIAALFKDQMNGEHLASFLNTVVANRLRFIEILVEDDETAFTVFETLNARGVALGTADLLKNYLFQLASRGGQQDLELAATLWSQATTRVPLDQLSKMLFHRLAGDVEDLREKRVFSAVKARVPKQTGVFDFLRDMHRTAEVYAALDDPSSALWHEYPDARLEVARLKLLRMTQARPLILAALPRFSDAPEKLANLLRRLICVGVRAWIARLNTGDVQRAYHKAAYQVSHGALRSPRAMVAALHTIHVEDEPFEAAFSQIALDPKGPRKKAVRYLLSALEADAGGQPIDFERGDATIEHVLPTNPAGDWSAFSAEDRRRDTVRLGNLMPLEYALNRALGNHAFAEKRTVYGQSSFTLARRVADFEAWSPATIRQHQASMAKQAVRIWTLADAAG